MIRQRERDIANDDQAEDAFDGCNQFSIGRLLSLSLRERVGLRRLGQSNDLGHPKSPHPLPAGEGIRANACRTLSITRSTSIPSMQNGARQRIFGYDVTHGYMKHGEHGFVDCTTRSRLPNGQTRSGSAGANRVTARVPTAAARCARPESDPTYSPARCSTAAASPSGPVSFNFLTALPGAWRMISSTAPVSSGPSRNTKR